MSTSVSTSFVKQYERDVHDIFQLQGSVLKPGVRSVGNVVGSSTTFQKVGKGVATTKSRHGTITPMNQDHTAIECTISDFYAGDWVDKLDEAKITIDERGAIARGGAMALGRKVDDQILTVLAASAEDSGVVTITSYAAIRNGITEMIQRLISNDAYEPGHLYGVLSPVFWSMLMTVDQFQNADFVGADGMEFKKNAPAKGRFKDWLGVMWTVHSAVPGIATSTADIFCWNKRSVGYATGKHSGNIASASGAETAIAADITWHGDRAAHFINHAMSGGACAIDATGMITSQVDDTGALPTS